mgnify:CR=1 FL=1
MQAWNDAWKTSTGRADWLEPSSFIQEILPDIAQHDSKRCIDIGCGPGRHAMYAARLGFHAIGVDAARSGVQYLRTWAATESASVDVSAADMNALPFENETFDCAIAWNVIYHGTADVVVRAVDEVARILTPSGIFILTLISKRNIRYGVGTEIEPDTFVNEDDPGETRHPHRFYGRTDAIRLLSAFDIIEAREVEQKTPGSYHWEIACRKAHRT